MAHDILDNELGNTSEGISESPRRQHQQDVEKIVDLVFSNKNVESKTNLNSRQIAAAAAALSYADIFDDDNVRKLTLKLLELKRSHGGQGMGMLQQVLSALIQRDHEPETESRSLRRKLFGF